MTAVRVRIGPPGVLSVLRVVRRAESWLIRHSWVQVRVDGKPKWSERISVANIEHKSSFRDTTSRRRDKSEVSR